MLDFCRAYADTPNLQPLVAELSWARSVVILGRYKDILEREVYLRAASRFGWIIPCCRIRST